MTVRIFEVEPAATIPCVDLVRLAAPRIGPIGQVPFPNARKYLVEFGLGYHKGVMLRNDLAIGASVLFNTHIIQRGVTYRYDRKRPNRSGGGRPSISAKNLLDVSGSCAATIV